MSFPRKRESRGPKKFETSSCCSLSVILGCVQHQRKKIGELNMTEFTAEFIGTMLLVLLGDGVVANVCLKGTKGHDSGWIVITIGWGLAVFTAVVVTGEFSGAHINPAVTVGLAAAGIFPKAKVALFIAAQLLGGAAGAFLVWVFYKDHYDITTDKATILATFATGPA